MPDEVQFVAGAKATPPAGTKIATDTVAGKEIQFVKLDLGGDGVANPVSDAIPVYNISGTAVNVTANITGSIQVSNFPSVQDVNIVSGTISATLTPPIQQGVSGSVSVSNFPVQQGISGTVFVSNFPPVQDVAIVSGSVSVTPPIMQGVSGTVGIIKTYLTPLAPTGTVIDLSSVQVASANANRTGFVLINVGSGWVSLGLGTAAILYAGVTLSPNGGTFEMDEYMFCNSAIYGIASITGTVLTIQEFI